MRKALRRGGHYVCATGTRPDTLSLTISDCGEGQTPRNLPQTILSLNKSNKMYIRFVQGQFNQGGTGALRFCGEAQSAACYQPP